jgi:UDP-N-acetylglucosamine--N-acetylmuramyl-(pentapeptide) pyrophosphoryl-undecaprenol N-acetylglucosamine transferase
MLKSELKIVITGGGSGGHLSVAKAVINSLLDDYNIPKENITYIGSDLGMMGEKKGNSLEKKQMAGFNINQKYIRAGKFQRKISLTSLPLLFRTLLGLKDSFRILRENKPHLIISTGGYVSVPVCIAGWFLHIPIFLHEQTASVGLSNKIVGKFAKRIYVSFENSLKYFNKKKSIHIGNIVRKEIFRKESNPDTDKEIVALNVTNKELPLLYISGGGLGSHTINSKILDSLDTLLKSYRILLQTGSNEIHRDYEKAMERAEGLPSHLKERFVVKKFIDEDSIGYVLNSMDIFIGRSGANTVYEIGVLKKIALLIPIPWVTHNEQYLNAKILKDIGTANILEEKDLKGADLKLEIERLKEQIQLRNINYRKLEHLFPQNGLVHMLDEILKDLIR